MEYEAFCEEHDLKLDLRGCCPECRDENGNIFPLDMQSYYLRPVSSVGSERFSYKEEAQGSIP